MLVMTGKTGLLSVRGHGSKHRAAAALKFFRGRRNFAQARLTSIKRVRAARA
jgi:hypothetical protein